MATRVGRERTDEGKKREQQRRGGTCGVTTTEAGRRGQTGSTVFPGPTRCANDLRPARKPEQPGPENPENSSLTKPDKTGVLTDLLSAPIVYRLGQEILILQSGVRFPVGAPFYEVGSC